jgi:hypothetical protein
LSPKKKSHFLEHVMTHERCVKRFWWSCHVRVSRFLLDMQGKPLLIYFGAILAKDLAHPNVTIVFWSFVDMQYTTFANYSMFLHPW